MNVNEFAETTKDGLDGFEHFWKTEKAHHPDLFPEEMGIEDWFEHFSSWMEANHD